jgi:hypothetical protein
MVHPYSLVPVHELTEALQLFLPCFNRPSYGQGSYLIRPRPLLGSANPPHETYHL